MKQPTPDSVIDEIREVRHRISASCDHDPTKLVVYLMQFQEQFRDRLTYIPEHATIQQANQPEANHLDRLSSAAIFLNS